MYSQYACCIYNRLEDILTPQNISLDEPYLLDLLTRVSLFKGTTSDEVAEILRCSRASVERYAQHETIFRTGDKFDRLCLVLQGTVDVLYEDLFGSSTLIERIDVGSLLVPSYALASTEPMSVSAVAHKETATLELGSGFVTQMCVRRCSHHARMLSNIIGILAEKNVQLTRRTQYLAPKTIRGKLAAYLMDEATEAASPTFTIPLNRQQLADFLGVDRSALSSELNRMRREGYFEVDGRSFTLNVQKLLRSGGGDAVKRDGA